MLTDQPTCDHQIEGNDYGPNIPCTFQAEFFYIPHGNIRFRPVFRCVLHTHLEDWMRDMIVKGLLIEATLEEYLVWEIMAS